MRCNFCFATFQDVKQSILPAGHLSKNHAIQVVQKLASFGFQKITFAGGEPTLCPWLPELIKTAKQSTMTTMIVTNGSKLNDEFLQINKSHLDWITLSIDSLNPNTNLTIGRAISGKNPLTVEYYSSLVEKVKQYGYGLKINTVVNSRNCFEDMNEFIRFAKPKRWKVLQALPISGQNDNNIADLEISENDFYSFVNNHEGLAEITNLVPETIAQLKGSYAMVDPAGRFFDNVAGRYNYSKSILEVGIAAALGSVRYDLQKFAARGGIYDWEIKKNASYHE